MTINGSTRCPNCFRTGYRPDGCPVCGFTDLEDVRCAYALPSGTLLHERYLIGRILGVGGFGITYKAFDLLLQEICAVKEFAPERLVFRYPGEQQMQVRGNAEGAWYQHGMQRFLEEAQILKALEDIPNVVHVWDYFQENQTAYYAMEFLDGTNMKKVIRMAGISVDEEDIRQIIVQIGTAMGQIHKKASILHRDISPENIYLLKDGSCKILDFGSARQQAMDEQQEFSIEFKQGFAPPEQYSRTGRQGSYTDVYALAATYYYALTGKRIPDAMARLDGKKYTPLFEMRSSIPKEISDAVDRALELDYKKRTQTMEEFVRGLEIKQKSGSGKPYLEVLSGNCCGYRWELPENTRIRIGRSARHSNIVIPGDPLISKIHCLLVYDSNTREFLLEDHSSNGVYVEGKRLEKERLYHYSHEITFSLATSNCTIKAGVSDEGNECH